MKSILSSLVLASVLSLGFSAPAAANSGTLLTHEEFQTRAHQAEALSERVKRIQTYQKKLQKLRFGQVCWQRRGPVVTVPELDPNAAAGALTLLAGAALVLADRRRRLSVV